jgi:type IV pilus assembly protein PilY1
MKSRASNITLGSLAAAALLLSAGLAHGAATIINPAGTVALGVKDTGALNTTAGSVAVNAGGNTGLAYKFADGAFYDATAPGCLCEGWGVSATTAGGPVSGYDGNGFANLTVNSFASGASTATSVVSLTSLPGLTVTHQYSPATNAPTALFRSIVTIKNDTGATLGDVRYVRVMDWDIPPTEFSEFVTIKGTATTSLLELSHDNGFSTANPLSSTSGAAGTVDVDFEDNGPTDHGAYFKFNFDELADGESYSFTIFYGAADSEAGALAAVGAEAIELYSFGQQSGDQINGTPATFIFGFKGVGGTALECGGPGQPPCPDDGDGNGVPEPMTLALVGFGLAAIGMTRRRRGARRAA